MLILLNFIVQNWLYLQMCKLQTHKISWNMSPVSSCAISADGFISIPNK